MSPTAVRTRRNFRGGEPREAGGERMSTVAELTLGHHIAI